MAGILPSPHAFSPHRRLPHTPSRCSSRSTGYCAHAPSPKRRTRDESSCVSLLRGPVARAGLLQHGPSSPRAKPSVAAGSSGEDNAGAFLFGGVSHSTLDRSCSRRVRENRGVRSRGRMGGFFLGGANHRDGVAQKGDSARVAPLVHMCRYGVDVRSACTVPLPVRRWACPVPLLPFLI